MNHKLLVKNIISIFNMQIVYCFAVTTINIGVNVQCALRHQTGLPHKGFKG